MKKLFVNTVIFLLIGTIIAYFVLLSVGFRPYITRSGSMEPAIRTGSICFVDTKVPFGDVAKGDIIAFRTSSGKSVTHRAVNVGKDAVETKGDANDVSDGFTTTKENFIGVTKFSIPYMGYVISYLQHPAGKIMIAGIILSIIAFGVIDYADDKHKRKEIEQSI